VEITSPLGTTVRLHNQTGGAAALTGDAFGLSRPADGPGDLVSFLGSAANGVWTLSVRDLAPGEAGILRGFALHVGRQL
jgi:subtilisin-like proprotein convertase family protein